MQSSAVYQVCVCVVCSVCSGKFNVQHLQKCWCLLGKTVDTPHLPASFNGVGVGRKLLAIAAKQPLLVFVFDTLDGWFFATPLDPSLMVVHAILSFRWFISVKIDIYAEVFCLDGYSIPEVACTSKPVATKITHVRPLVHTRKALSGVHLIHKKVKISIKSIQNQGHNALLHSVFSKALQLALLDQHSLSFIGINGLDSTGEYMSPIIFGIVSSSSCSCSEYF